MCTLGGPEHSGQRKIRDLHLPGIQSQLITHTHTPDKRQGKQCHLFPSLLSESMIASTITSCLSCPGDRRKPDSTQIRAGANLMRWRSTQTQCCVNALLSAPGRSSLAKFSPPLETFKMAVAQSRTQRDPPA